MDPVQQEDHALERWEAFALRQEARAAPPPARPAAPAAGPAVPCRLRLAALRGLPLFLGDDSNLEVAVSLTLWDTAARCFLGNTARSGSRPYDMRRCSGRRGFALDPGLEVAWHTHSRLASLAAVAEVVLVQRDAAGVAVAERAAGWALLPLLPPAATAFAASEAVGPGSPVAAMEGARVRGLRPALAPRHGAGAASPPGALRSAAVFTGSARSMLLQAAWPEECYPPSCLASNGTDCTLEWEFEAWPEESLAPAWVPLLPPDFVVSARDVVPGLRRARANGGGALGAGTSLLPPRLEPMRVLELSVLSVHLPDGFMEAVVRRLATAHDGHASHAPAELAPRLRLRASAHNGRCFVGPPVGLAPLALGAVPGRRGCHRLTAGGGAVLTWVPADPLVAIVLELLYVPAGRSSCPGPSSSGSGGGAVVLAWAAVAPFGDARGSREGPVATARQHRLAMRSGPGRWLRPQPVLAWRAMLEATNRLSPEAPEVSLRLRQLEGPGTWPPPPPQVCASEPLTSRLGSAGPELPANGSKLGDGRTWACAASDHKELRVEVAASTWHIRAQHAQQHSWQGGTQEPALLHPPPSKGSPFLELGALCHGAAPALAAQRESRTVLRVVPAVEEGGEIAAALAGPEAAGGSPRALCQASVQRAARQVEQYLQRRPEDDGGEEQIAWLVQEQLVGNVAAAREACKGALLRRGAQRAAHAMAQPGREALDVGTAPGQQFCVSVRPGELTHKRVVYTNRHSSAMEFSLSSDHPRLRLKQPSLSLRPGESGRIGMALDARSAAAGDVYDMAVTVWSAGGAGSWSLNAGGEEAETFGVRMHVSS